MEEEVGLIDLLAIPLDRGSLERHHSAPKRLELAGLAPGARLDRRDLEHASDAVDLPHVTLVQILHRRTPVHLALGETLMHEQLNRRPHRVPGNPRRRGNRYLAQRRPRWQLVAKDALTKHPSDLLGRALALEHGPPRQGVSRRRRTGSAGRHPRAGAGFVPGRPHSRFLIARPSAATARASATGIVPPVAIVQQGNRSLIRSALWRARAQGLDRTASHSGLPAWLAGSSSWTSRSGWRRSRSCRAGSATSASARANRALCSPRIASASWSLPSRSGESPTGSARS